ncbi:protein-glutamine gamma-glutamyltransferase 2 [Megalops cyprinoides]|uniref:protein-glutamine gamma-glutamyltransferase 2 n=1 Tax=Megalops cyprinoides TaxID=118141 RepID=UPI0018648413|nr:protein-glutamine gamma-glutamyltransferase 2 [Megalops cyprinoides]
MAQALDIERWDLECQFNNTDHRTDLNGVDRLIVRRGQPFTISLHLRSGTFVPGVSNFSLIVETGPCSSEATGTRATFGLSGSIDETRWSASPSCSDGGTVSLSICSPPNAPIGRYSLTLDQGSRLNLGEFVLLFNPWCPRDSVYMDSDEKLKEYVLSQDGIIYRGSYKFPIATPWNFGQFEYGILDACLRILDENPKFHRSPEQDCAGRQSPVYVSRVLSAMINCNDDKGVLLGRWEKDSTDGYVGGVSPMAWKGSVEILRGWDTTSCQPVRYGQCWVFAAVACSVSRALGIPCRVITNYLSAHDTNSNLVIERYVDENGQPVQRSRDMIWNYHCWVESWMTRPDLSPGFDGWQASDPTPQEKSEGVYCCGPIPLKAIREGELMLKYDAPFVFAEVNADVVTVMKHRDGTEQKVLGSSLVGQRISTKSVGSDTREDITHLYKYPEGSSEERQAFEKANHQNKLLQQANETGLNIKIKTPEAMKKGCDFSVHAIISNRTPATKMCRLMFFSRAASYNGILGNECGFKDLLNVQIPPGEDKDVPLNINYCKYGGNITEDNLIKLAALLIDYSNKDAFLTVRNIVLEDPEIKIRVLGEPKVNRELTAEITVQNPLEEPLEGCCFSMEGANLTGGKVLTQTLGSPVGPKQEAKVKVKFTPTRYGLRKLVVDFNSNKLGHVKGYRNVIIGK